MCKYYEMQKQLTNKYDILKKLEPFNRSETLARIVEKGFPVKKIAISSDAFEKYLKDTDSLYTESYKQVSATNFNRKALEHFCSFQLLDLKIEDVFMDVASCGSNVPSILENHYMLTNIWKQDISYKPGVDIENKAIGSNAADIPIESDSIDKISLHCAFEHFEGDSDTGFIIESARILKNKGKVCIIPLYISSIQHILTNPKVIADTRMPNFDKNIPLYFHDKKNIHGHFYDWKSLIERVLLVAVRKGLSPVIIDINFDSIKYNLGTNLAIILQK